MGWDIADLSSANFCRCTMGQTTVELIHSRAVSLPVDVVVAPISQMPIVYLDADWMQDRTASAARRAQAQTWRRFGQSWLRFERDRGGKPINGYSEKTTSPPVERDMGADGGPERG